MPPVVLLLAILAPEPGPSLAVDGARFTVDGAPAFLLGCSYYAALGASDATLAADLDRLQASGFNWIRVWVTWAAYGDVSAVDEHGAARQPYLERLGVVLRECAKRGMVVDVTFSRGAGLPDQAAHLAAVQTVARAIAPFRNAFIDLANERNIRDARYVSHEELAELAAAVREIDPRRLITASHAGGELQQEDVRKYLEVATVDFLSPHRPRSSEAARECGERTAEVLGWTRDLGREVPVLHQEPFRRGFTNGWEPTVEDFLADLAGAVAGGAAGWCFHNGSVRNAEGDGRPRRSFDLSEHTLLEQLDEVELEVIRRAGEVAFGER